VVVYDIQDETGRTQLPRPFPFMRTIDPRQYSMQLMESTRLPAITYKALGHLDEAGWRAWLSQAQGIEFISGWEGPSPACAMRCRCPRRSASAAATQAASPSVAWSSPSGTPALRSEAARLLAKGIEGCGYFISQTVYSARPTQRLLRDYCATAAAPAASRGASCSLRPLRAREDARLLRWLGVNVAPDTERAILGAADPLAKSIEICRDNLRRILDEPYAGEIPLGVNVESVSINRDEIDASIELFNGAA